MEKFLSYLLGTHDLAFYVAGLVIAIFGSLIYKFHAWNLHKLECETKGHVHSFKFKFWIKDNWIDLVASLIVSFLSVRFIDLLIHWLNPKLEAAIGFRLPETEDQVAYFLIVSILVQWAIHKYYRKKNKK